MKTQEDVLSFHDLEVQRGISYLDENGNLSDVALQDSINVEEMSVRLIHTFLEWDLYGSYIYNLGWSLTYTACQGDHPSISMATRMDTLQEAEIIAIKKIGRLLGEQVHLEAMKTVFTVIAHPSPYDGFYKVTNGAGEYRGMVEIAQMEQLK